MKNGTQIELLPESSGLVIVDMQVEGCERHGPDVKPVNGEDRTSSAFLTGAPFHAIDAMPHAVRPSPSIGQLDTVSQTDESSVCRCLRNLLIIEDLTRDERFVLLATL